jgi:hypothetical protein
MVASKSKEIRAAIRIFMANTLSQYSGEIIPLRRNQPSPAVGYWPWNAASRRSPQLCKQLRKGLPSLVNPLFCIG